MMYSVKNMFGLDIRLGDGTVFSNDYESVDEAYDRLCEIMNDHYDHLDLEDQRSIVVQTRVNGKMTYTGYDLSGDIKDGNRCVGTFRINMV